MTHGYTLLFSPTHVGEMDLSGKFVWRTEFRGTLEMEGKLYTDPCRYERAAVRWTPIAELGDAHPNRVS